MRRSVRPMFKQRWLQKQGRERTALQDRAQHIFEQPGQAHAPLGLLAGYPPPGTAASAPGAATPAASSSGQRTRDKYPCTRARKTISGVPSSRCSNERTSQAGRVGSALAAPGRAHSSGPLKQGGCWDQGPEVVPAPRGRCAWQARGMA